jgi:hypothetical protein
MVAPNTYVKASCVFDNTQSASVSKCADSACSVNCTTVAPIVAPMQCVGDDGSIGAIGSGLYLQCTAEANSSAAGVVIGLAGATGAPGGGMGVRGLRPVALRGSAGGAAHRAVRGGVTGANPGWRHD